MHNNTTRPERGLTVRGDTIRGECRVGLETERQVSAGGEISPESRLRELAREINETIRPLRPMSVEDVHVRAMYVISDQRNVYGGRFDQAELEHVVRALTDTPVLVGHRKDTLPVARVFKAELVERSGAKWVKAYFYWPRAAERADELAANIDAGVVKECSIGFLFRKAECDTCGEDIRSCPHDDPVADVGFVYRGVSEILEVSLVYRGAVRDTRIDSQLLDHGLTTVSLCDEDENSDDHPNADDFSLTVRQILPSATSGGRAPHQSLSYILHGDAKGWRALHLDKTPAPEALTPVFDSLEAPDTEIIALAQITGMRGKERRAVDELIRFLERKRRSVTSVRVALLATIRLGYEWRAPENATHLDIFLSTISASERPAPLHVTISAPLKPFAEGESLATVGPRDWTLTLSLFPDGILVPTLEDPSGNSVVVGIPAEQAACKRVSLTAGARRSLVVGDTLALHTRTAGTVNHILTRPGICAVANWGVWARPFPLAELTPRPFAPTVSESADGLRDITFIRGGVRRAGRIRVNVGVSAQ